MHLVILQAVACDGRHNHYNDLREHIMTAGVPTQGPEMSRCVGKSGGIKRAWVC